MWLLSSLLQLEEDVVDLFSKTVKDDGLAIDLELLRSPGPSLCIFRLGIIRFGSWDSLASSRARGPTLRQRHLWTRG
jgi:hypothetical protein